MCKISVSLLFMVAVYALFSASAAQATAADLDVQAATPVCDSITGDTTWNAAGSPYVIECFGFAVEQGATLTLEPGVTVVGKAHNIDLEIKGHLQAVGTVEQPIVFTSQQDTAPNQWLGLRVDGGTVLLRHVIVRYGYDNLSVRNVSAGEVRIEGSRIEAASRYGVDSLGSRIVISNTEFLNINDQTFSRPLVVDAGDVGNLTDIRLEGNIQNRIQVRPSALAANATWRAQNGMQAYELEGQVAVNPGVTLAIAPGVTVMGGGNGAFAVKGRLEAVGTADAPILFTSVQNTGPSQWDGINFDGGQGVFRHVTVRYAFSNIYAINDTTLEVRDSILSKGGSDGLMVRSNSTATIVCSDLTDNSFAGIRLDGSANATVVGSAFTGNGNYGVHNTTQNVVDARYNWWGDPSGPGGVGPGTGNAVTEKVQYAPWLQAKRCLNPQEGYWDFGGVRIWADAFDAQGDTVTATGNVRLGAKATDKPYIAVAGSATFPLNPSADSKLTILGASLLAEQLSLGAGVFQVDQDCVMAGTFVPMILIKGSSLLTLRVTEMNARLCAKATSPPGLYGQGTIPIGFLPNNLGKQVALDFRFVEEQGAFHWHGGATADVTVIFAGGTYSATFTLDDTGLLAPAVRLELPKISDKGLSLEIKDLRIGLDGKLGGSIADFTLDLVAFKLGVKKPAIDGNRIQAANISVAVKPELSGLKEVRVAGSLTGLTIDDSGLHVEGGGFDLAFKVSDIGIAGKANFAPEAATGAYIVKMDAEVQTPDFQIAAGVTLALLNQQAQVQRILVAIQALPPNAPTVLIEPMSQLYLYKVQGELTLTEARRVIEAGVKAKSLVALGKQSLLEASATLTANWHPEHYLKLAGTAQVLKRSLGKASLLFTPTSIWLQGDLGIREEKVILAALLKGGMGLDKECEFTAVLQVEGETTIKASAVFVAVPPWDVTARLGGTVGKHKYQATKQWGLRGYGEFPLVGKGWVWVGFSPGSGTQVGTGDGSDIYRPIWPTEAMAATADGINPQLLAPGISPAVAGDPRVYAQQQAAIGEFTIGAATEFLLVEYLPTGAGMNAPALQLTRPDATLFAPQVTETSLEHNARYYTVSNPAQGRWQVTAAPGAYVSVLATDPQPVVKSAAVARQGSGYRIDYEITDDDPLGEAEVWIEVIAPPEGNNSGQQVIIDARSGQDGTGCPRTAQVAASQVPLSDELSAAASIVWTPTRLASGAYQVRLVVSNGVHTIIHDVGTIDWQDTTPPTAASQPAGKNHRRRCALPALGTL